MYRVNTFYVHTRTQRHTSLDLSYTLPDPVSHTFHFHQSSPLHFKKHLRHPPQELFILM